MEQQTIRVLEGDMEDLPAQEKTDVIVFLSSTFTDFAVERNYLMNSVTRKLREHCMTKGLEFKFMDMRWGVRDEASVDHTTTEIVLDEVRLSKDFSKATFFLAFLGDKYGSRQIPHYIEATEFRLLRRIAMRRGSDVPLLDQWFVRDDNAEPAVYRLRSITDILTHYDDDENETLKSQDHGKWNTINGKLLAILRGAAEEAYEEKQISKEARHMYFKSVTESEIEEGIIHQSPLKNKVIVCIRKFLDINIKDEKAVRFVDLKDGKIDSEAEELRERLKVTRVQPLLGPEELKKYSLNWTPIGIDENDSQHKEYLDTLVNQIGKTLMNQIEACQKDDSEYGMEKNPLYREILHHLHFAQDEIKLFADRNDVMQDIQERMLLFYNSDGEVIEEITENENLEKETKSSVLDEISEMESPDVSVINEKMNEAQQIQAKLDKLGCKFIHGDFIPEECHPISEMKEAVARVPEVTCFTRPVILFGPSGSGKTALLAKAAQQSRKWFPGCATITRFLGTTKITVYIRALLYGLCAQIWRIYKMPVPYYLDLMGDYQYLCQYFIALLWKIDTKSKPLVLILDSVDQLNDADNSCSMSWLPLQLPVNVHILISMQPQGDQCFQNILSKMPYSDQYLEMPAMTPESANDMISRYLKSKSRRITKLQRRHLLEKFHTCQQPLYLKAQLHHALKWTSDTAVSGLSLGDNVQMTINKLFDELEKVHGKVIVKKTFGYMSASKEGISKTELENLLSLSDEVLQDAYLYHLPPIPDQIVIPPSVISLLFKDIGEFISLKRYGPVKVITWCHSQFKEVCWARYLTPACKKNIHTEMAEYFEGIWFEKAKPLELYKVKKGSYPNAERGVKPQPLKITDSLYNVRKLVELPYHYIKSEQFEKCRDNCILNFEFLQGYVKCFTVSEVVVLLKEFLSVMDMAGEIDCVEVYSDIETVLKLLHQGNENIRKDSNNFAVEIVSQLGPDYKGTPQMTTFVQDALKNCKESITPLFVPANKVAPRPGGVLKLSVSVSIHNKNTDEDVRKPISLDEENSTLYAMCSIGKEQYLYTLDYTNQASTISRQPIKSDVKVMQLLGKNKYNYLQDSHGNGELREVSSWEKGLFSYPPDSISVSHSGKVLIYTSVSKMYICKLGETIKDLEQVHELDLEENILHTIISPDDKYIAVFDKYLLLATFEISSGKQLFRNQREDSYNADEDSSRKIKLDLQRSVAITNSNTLVCPVRTDKSNPGVTSLCIVGMWTGEVLHVLDCSKFGSESVFSIHSSEQYIVTIDKTKNNQHNIWRMWNLETGKLVTSSENADTYLKQMESCDEKSTNPMKKGSIDVHLFGGKTLFLATIEADRMCSVNISYLGSIDSPLKCGIPYCNLIGHNRPVIQMFSAFEGTELLTASLDNTIKVWDIHKIITNFDEKFGKNKIDTENVRNYHDMQVMTESSTTRYAISRDEKNVYISTTSGQLIVHDLENNNLVHSHKLKDGRIDFLLVSSSGQYIIMSAAEDGKVSVVEKENYTCKYELNHGSKIDCLTEANDVLVAGTSGREAVGTIWDVFTGKILKKVKLMYSLSVLAISSTGSPIVSCFFDFPVLFGVNMEGGMDMTQVDTKMCSAKCVAVSTDDKMALIGSSDGHIRIITMEGKYMFRLGQNSEITTARFTPDNKKVISAGFKNIYLWNLETLSLVYKVKKHDDYVTNVLFESTGNCFVTASLDKKIIMSDISTGLSVATYNGHYQFEQLRMTKDGEKVVFVPDTANYVGIIEPNKTLQKLMEGGDKVSIKNSLLKAQAMALSFSSQQIVQQSSTSCQIL